MAVLPSIEAHSRHYFDFFFRRCREGFDARKRKQPKTFLPNEMTRMPISKQSTVVKTVVKDVGRREPLSVRLNAPGGTVA
jgi:hypothetical protein